MLLPRSSTDRLGFVAFAVTAGICEEILYRGFGFDYVRGFVAPFLQWRRRSPVPSMNEHS
jgi:membrane protease YdiL (CAAX protease family)